MEGIVFNIQKFSLHDGAGIRTLVFLKGCPLNCIWCANPEGKAPYPQLAYNPGKCIGMDQCDACRQVCPQGAVGRGNGQQAAIDRTRCDNCGLCAERCPSKALEIFGRRVGVDEIIRIVEEDGAFYHRSGGGLTLSGGEPLNQIDFSLSVLEAAKKRGIRTAVETSGLGAWRHLAAVCRWSDQIFFDIKTLDRQRHISQTGADNAVILNNFKQLCRDFPDLSLTVRTPVIPGLNDDPEAVSSVRRFVLRHSSDAGHELLPYHRFGEPKYRYLGMEAPLPDLPTPSERRMAELRHAVETARPEGPPGKA